MQDATTNCFYREAAYNSGTNTWAWAGSEVQLNSVENAARGNDSLADSINGRFREFVPNALGGGSLSAITSGGTAQSLAFASITGLTAAEYYMRLYVTPDTSNGHYLMVGHDDSAIPETNAGRGELHLADITYNEAGNYRHRDRVLHRRQLHGGQLRHRRRGGVRPQPRPGGRGLPGGRQHRPRRHQPVRPHRRARVRMPGRLVLRS